MNKQIINLDLQLDENNAEAGALEILKVLRPSWKQPDIKFIVFSEGITNKLIGCHEVSDKKKNDCIVIRIYGQATDLIIDRDLEKLNMQILHAAGCSAALYATFKNGLAYEFVQGDCLDEKTVRDPHIGRLIAKAMVQMHHADIDKILEGQNVSVDREAGIFKKTRKFLSLVPESFDNPAKQERLSKEVKSKAELIAEMDKLQPQLEALGGRVAFCHNDLLLKNIVYNKQQEKASFIDYEYGCFSYIAHDIGDHFTEWAGVDDLDFDRYPDRETQLPWLRTYLEFDREASGGSASEVTDRDVEVLYVQVNKFALMAHFFWGIWGLIQSKYSLIDFDYLDYAILKLNEYFRLRDEHLALKMPQ